MAIFIGIVEEMWPGRAVNVRPKYSKILIEKLLVVLLDKYFFSMIFRKRD